jgi:cyclic pyranopterin monophosphate synthase
VDLTHVDESGNARMVDVSGKPRQRRIARAAGRIRLQPETVQLIREHRIEKGEVLSVARIAGILAAKRTPELIPLCHHVILDSVEVNFQIEGDGISIQSTVVCTDRTGVEMEALTAVSCAALTIYDMCKAVDTKMVIDDVHLVEKRKEELPS